MKRFELLLIALLLMGGSMVMNAQSLKGRVYYSKNIMTEEMRKEVAELDLDDDEEVNADMVEKTMKATCIAFTVTFFSDKQLELKMDSYMDEKILEKSGISWAKRKALKAVMGTFPSQKEKFNYTVKGNVVTCGSGKDKEVFTLSKDGKYLYGKTEDGYKFTLTRTK